MAALESMALDRVAPLPQTLAHSRIASNLTRLLNDRLDREAPSLVAIQRTPVEFGDRPAPDVGVVDVGFSLHQRSVRRIYLAAEVTNGEDAACPPGCDRPTVEIRRDLYRAHGDCAAVLLVAEDRMEVVLDLRTEDGWRTSVLKAGEAELEIGVFGFWCLLDDLYEGTPLRPRRQAAARFVASARRRRRP